MEELPESITPVIAILTLFLMFAAGSRYAVKNNFVRTRLIMTAFFCFIVLTLLLSFWPFLFDSLPFTVPAIFIGIVVGHVIGVRTERQKLEVSGLEHYMEHFAHVPVGSLASLSWWSFINYYTVMSGLLLINLVGLSTVIFAHDEVSAVRTTMVGAFLLGTIVPYLIHLWSIRAPHHAKSTTSDRKKTMRP